MQTILNEYNKFNAIPLESIKELEDIGEIVHSETVGETRSEIFFKRFCSLRNVHYYVLDVGKLDDNGDVTGDLITLEYGLL